MGRSVARVSDPNSGGGIVTTSPQSTVFAEGLAIAVSGSTGTKHKSGTKHKAGVWQTANASSTVYINGLPVNASGDSDSCGHIRIGGSNSVFVG